MTSKADLIAKFNKIVDQFTLELSDDDKQRLVAAHNMNHRYFKESRIMVMTMLKAMGKFSHKNPEGLLDIADFLGRDDLKEKYSPVLKTMTNSGKLRKVSSAVFLDHQYSNVEVKSALDITLGQIELGHATSGLLQKICARSKPGGQNKRLSEHFEELTQKLDEALTMLRKVQVEHDSELLQPPVPESTPSILQQEDIIQPQQETYDPPIYGNIGVPGENKTTPKVLSVAEIMRGGGVNTWGTPPGNRRTDKPPPPVPAKPLTPGNERRGSGNERRGSGKIPILPPTTKGGSLKARKNDPPLVNPPPPPIKPKPTGRRTNPQVAIPPPQLEDEEHYTIPHSASTGSFSSTGNRFSGSFNTGSDSGITGDFWPRPETKPKGDTNNVYQPLLYNLSEEEEIIYSEPL